MQETEKSSAGKTRFELRLSPAEAVRLEAIATRLRISKSEVLRFALAAEPHRQNGDADKQAAAIGEALDALTSRARAVEDRLKNIESLMDSAVDLLLSISRSAQRGEAAPTSAKTPPEAANPAGASWAEFLKKTPKLNPVMSEPDWLEFLRGRYEKVFGHPPDLSS